MISRDLVKRTLEFAGPPRIPRQLWILPWAQLHHPEQLKAIQEDFPDDIIHAPGFYAERPQTQGDPHEVGTFIDEWGCEFLNRQTGIIGEVKCPLVKTWADLDRVVPPTSWLTIQRDQVNSFCRSSDKFILSGACPRPFERLQFLRGTENVMLDLGLGTPELFELLSRLHAFNIKLLEVWADTAVDALMFMDDWGSQRSLLINPEMWRRIFKPLYADYITIAHLRGKKVFMHSDGFIQDILPDLIELGVDAINSQIFCMDLESLARIGKGRITFWGELDRQHLMPHGSSDDVVEAVTRVHNTLSHNGGVIAQMEFGAGTNPANVRTALETWNRLCSES
jgi:uroporphyrinogen decarboxylase